MKANDIFNPAYRQDYLAGYATGFNPLLQINEQECSGAFISGFQSGRMDYECMNGTVAEGIPANTVTKKVLEDFLLAGMLGLQVETDGYSLHQLTILAKWYLSGIEKYDPAHSTYLLEILENEGISLK